MNIDVPVPDGESGDWKVGSFIVSEEEARLHQLRCAFHPGMGRRGVQAGTYKKLTRNGDTIMSNTPAEIDDISYFIYTAKGDVLINGLGLGVCVFGIQQENKNKKEKVTSITIIEKSEDVIKLVAPYLPYYASVIHADAFEFLPPKRKRYDAVWHDIWDNICSDNLPEMHKLHRKYGRRSNWQGSWCRELCEMRR